MKKIAAYALGLTIGGAFIIGCSGQENNSPGADKTANLKKIEKLKTEISKKPVTGNGYPTGLIPGTGYRLKSKENATLDQAQEVMNGLLKLKLSKSEEKAFKNYLVKNETPYTAKELQKMLLTLPVWKAKKMTQVFVSNVPDEFKPIDQSEPKLNKLQILLKQNGVKENPDGLSYILTALPVSKSDRLMQVLASGMPEVKQQATSAALEQKASERLKSSQVESAFFDVLSPMTAKETPSYIVYIVSGNNDQRESFSYVTKDKAAYGRLHGYAAKNLKPDQISDWARYVVTEAGVVLPWDKKTEERIGNPNPYETAYGQRLKPSVTEFSSPEQDSVRVISNISIKGLRISKSDNKLFGTYPIKLRANVSSIRHNGTSFNFPPP